MIVSYKVRLEPTKSKKVKKLERRKKRQQRKVSKKYFNIAKERVMKVG